MCENFDLFDEAQTKYEKEKKSKKIVEDRCEHPQILDDNGIKLCKVCGEEISRDISFDKEWRYYGAADTRHVSDPSRCQKRNVEERTIYKDVVTMGFSDKIITSANDLYEEVTKKRIYRGESRKAIVFACIFHTYKTEGNPQNCENLIKVFGLDRKVGLKGLKIVNLNASKETRIKTTYITPENLITEIMDKFDADQSQKDEVLEIYGQIKNKSSILNRSRPQSVASGLVRYYILLKKKDISIAEFKSKVDLSELTINRILKEISIILETPEILE